MKLLQVNTADGRGATGGVPELLHRMALARGIDARLATGRGCLNDDRRVRFGSRMGVASHLLATRLLDRHGLHSYGATRSLLRRIEDFDPDIIHLHNIHGYYLHYPTLMRELDAAGRPVVWTMHDCWAVTGHCAFPVGAACSRWEDGCHHCPMRGQYPASWLADRSRSNYREKRRIFAGLRNFTLVAVSPWLDGVLGRSFLAGLPRMVVRNGVDISVFHPSAAKASGPLVLGVASHWDDRKGLDDFIRLRNLLPREWRIRLIGLTPAQMRQLPAGIEGAGYIADSAALAHEYSQASVFVNPTRGESCPMTVLEALACGTPVVTYHAGGASDAITPDTGRAVPAGRLDLLLQAILEPLPDSAGCRRAAEADFDMHRNMEPYFRLYDSLLARTTRPHTHP